ncbi:MAG: CYTH domain-containing protein [Nanoarchaeota archaeon]|nr:CYTH domain-containing protein [Nanoarchaeota archaeon]
MKEVELRSFVSEEKYEKLKSFFDNNAEFVKEDEQETHYFNCEQDLRIQCNNYYSKIWMKKGELHDDSREEIELNFDKSQFPELQKLFKALNYEVSIKWFRNRREYKWKNVSVMLDYTKGYGYILELEILTEDDESKALNRLKTLFKELSIEVTPKEVFKEKYEEYKKNWMNPNY